MLTEFRRSRMNLWAKITSLLMLTALLLFGAGLPAAHAALERVGPVDPAVNKQIGGDCMTVANVEYEAPLVRDVLRGVVHGVPSRRCLRAIA